MTLRNVIVVSLLILGGCATTDNMAATTPPTVSGVTQPVDSGSPWAISDYVLQSGVEPYPWGLPHGLDIDPTDDKGLHLYERNGERFVHPVAQGQYVLMMLNSYSKTGDDEFLDRATINLDSILDAAVERDGAVFYPYQFDFPLYGKDELTLHAPWWSGMAQGQILSALVRMYEATGDEAYKEAADETFASFAPRPITDWPIVEPAVTLIDEAGMLWLEEYSGDLEPAYVLNGHIFGIFGLYDYWELTGSADAAAMIDGAATAVAYYLPDFRAGPEELSWYGLTIKPDTQGQHAKYHRIHQEQLRTLAEITGESLFSDYADLFASDL